MIDLINQHRAPLRAESESLDEQLKELDKQKRILGVRKTVVTSKLAVLNELASDLEKEKNAPKEAGAEPDPTKGAHELLKSQPAFFQKLMERTSAVIAEDMASSLLAVDSAESQEATTERADAERATRPKWTSPSPEAFPFVSPGMPFTLGSLLASGVLGPVPIWMATNPCYPLGNVAGVVPGCVTTLGSIYRTVGATFPPSFGASLGAVAPAVERVAQSAKSCSDFLSSASQVLREKADAFEQLATEWENDDECGGAVLAA